jgi:hypothetical protein
MGVQACRRFGIQCGDLLVQELHVLQYTTSTSPTASNGHRSPSRQLFMPRGAGHAGMGDSPELRHQSCDE